MKTILIADDEEPLRRLVQTTLESAEVRILQAADGEAALELARRERPDLIVLDVMMPRRTGLEVARALRLDPATATLPILMLTGLGEEKDREEVLALGVSGYLVKPFSPLELMKRVQEVLAIAETAENKNESQPNDRVRIRPAKTA
jgi:two-component system alkaline phosphatase synthesis response regulator PhoP